MHIGPHGSRVLVAGPRNQRGRSAAGRWASVKLSLACAAVLLLFLGTSSIPAGADPTAVPLDAIGRVLDVDKEFKCTGFILASVNRTSAGPYTRYYESTLGWYENTLVTAGHCFEHVKYFRARNGATHTVQAIVGYSDHHNGYDVLVARFNTGTPMPSLEPAYAHELHPGEALMLVGYGRSALQVNVNPFLGYSAQGDLIVNGVSGPGDSGSPVLIPGTRKVVGILHSGTVDVPEEARRNPYFCLFQSCPSSRPYYATPIDRLQGIARW